MGSHPMLFRHHFEEKIYALIQPSSLHKNNFLLRWVNSSFENIFCKIRHILSIMGRLKDLN